MNYYVGPKFFFIDILFFIITMLVVFNIYASTSALKLIQVFFQITSKPMIYRFLSYLVSQNGVVFIF